MQDAEEISILKEKLYILHEMYLDISYRLFAMIIMKNVVSIAYL